MGPSRKRENKRVTISEVAQTAGVSTSTVSNALNNRTNSMAPETFERILKVIQELDYRPSPIARSLATARTATIGLVVPDISNPYFSAIARGIEQVAYARDYSILLCNTGEDASRELEVLQTLRERYVDGVIVCGLRQDDAPLLQALTHFRASVIVNRRFVNGTVPAILVDDVLGGYLATRHLLQLGHTSIGFLAGPTTSYSGTKRLQGYEQALIEAGIERQEGWVQNCIPTAAGGEAATHSLLTNHPELTALFCFNDLIAVGALRACAAVGRRIPKDLAIVGYDDTMLASLVSPPLTSCHVPCLEMGSQAVSTLLNCINDDTDMCNETVITPELVIRASTVGIDTTV
ncbi:MAG: LacI family DNA-binding transcriptional regulator [Chloroflexota bacterium]